jgi:hypothetical protein
METTQITAGRDGNINSLVAAAKNFDQIRASFKGVYKDLQDEQSSKVRGGQGLAYDSIIMSEIYQDIPTVGIMVHGQQYHLNLEKNFLTLLLKYLKNQESITLMIQVFFLINKENYLEKIKFIVQHHLNLKTLLIIGMTKS